MRRREGDAAVVVFKEALEIDKVALGGFRSEVTVLRGQRMLSWAIDTAGAPWMLTSRPNARQEHEIELLGLRDLIARVRVRDLVITAQLTQLWTRVVVELGHGEDCLESRSSDGDL